MIRERLAQSRIAAGLFMVTFTSLGLWLYGLFLHWLCENYSLWAVLAASVVVLIFTALFVGRSQSPLP